MKKILIVLFIGLFTSCMSTDGFSFSKNSISENSFSKDVAAKMDNHKKEILKNGRCDIIVAGVHIRAIITEAECNRMNQAIKAFLMGLIEQGKYISNPVKERPVEKQKINPAKST